jgi:hypothetical protein
MAKLDGTNTNQAQRRPPATTPEGREQQLTALAMDAIEKRIINGTASAQELVYFAKIGSPNSKVERKLLETQQALLEAKIDGIASQSRTEELYKNALSAMRSYSGDPQKDDEYDQNL